MPNKDDLRILINAVLDEKLNTDSINKQLKRIQRNLNKIRVNIQIDENLVKTLNNFSQQFNKIETLAKNTGKVVTESILPDGTKVKMTTFDGMQKGFQQIVEEAKDTKKVLDQTVKSTDKSNEAFNNEIKTVKQLTDEVGKLTKQTELYNAKREELSKKIIAQNKEGTIKRTINTDEKGNVTTFSDTFDFGKEEKDKQKIIEQRKKLEQDYEQWWLKSLKNREIAQQRTDEKFITSQNNVKQKVIELQRTNEFSNKTISKLNNMVDSSNNVKELDRVINRIQTLNNALANRNAGNKVDNYISSSNIRADNLLGVHSKTVDTVALENWRQSVGKLTSDTPQLTQKMKELDLQFRKIEGSARDASRMSMTFGEMLRVAMEKFPIWMLASTAFYLPIRLTTQLVNTLYLLDDRLVSINKVMDDVDLSTVFEDGIKSANTYGQTIDNALKSIEEIGKLGFNQADATALSNNAMLLSTVGEFKDSADAANYLVAIMRQYKMEIADTSKVVDSLNEVSNKTGADTIGLAQALSKASASARNAGVSFDEFMGMVSSTVETLKISGDEAGTFYKALFTRLMRSDTQKDIEALGIATKDASGEMLSATEIIKNLGDVYQELDKTTRSSIAESLGGVWHANKVMTLLEQQEQVFRNAEISAESYGSATRELTTFSEGLTFKTNVMKSSFQELAMTLGQNGIRDLLVNLIESATFMTRGFNDLTEATNGWNLKLPILAAGIFGVSKALTYLSTVAKGAKLSLGWIGVGIVGAEVLLSTFAGASRSLAKTTDTFVESAKKTSDTANQLEVLIKKYEELKPISNQSAESQEEYKRVLGEIQKIAPEVISATNEYGDALGVNKDKADQFIESLKTMTDEQLKQAKLTLDIDITNTNNDLDTAKRELKKFDEEYRKIFDDAMAYQKKYGVSSITEASTEYQERIKNLSGKALRDASQEFTNFYLAMTKHTSKLEEYAEKRKKVDELESQVSGLETRKQSIDGLTNSQNKLNQTAQDGIDNNNSYVDSTDEIISVSEEQQKALDNAYSSISNINKILEDYQENNSLSADSINDIVQEYPHLMEYMNDEEELIKQLGIERDKEAEIVKANAYEKVKASEFFYQSSISLLEQQLQQYGVAYEGDLSRFRTLAEAKLEIEKQLLTNLAMAWKDYVAGTSVGANWGSLGTFQKNGTYKVTEAGAKFFQDKNNAEAFVNLYNQRKAQQEALDKAIKNVSSVGLNLNKIGLSSSGSKDKKSSSGSKNKDEAKEVDLTQALINTANAEARKAEAVNKANKEQLDAINGQQKYREQIELTNKLISGQENQINKLKDANNKLHLEAQKVRKQTKYDTLKWFDDDLNASLSFEQLKGSLKTGTAQDELQKLFDQLQKIKQAHRDNSQSIHDLTKSTKEYNQELNNLQLTAMKSEYDAQLDDIDFLIQKHELLTSDLEETSSEYSKAIAEQSTLINQKIALTEQEIQKTLDLMSVQQEDSLIMGELKERYEDLVIAQMQYQQELSNLKREIKDKQREIANEIIDIIKDAYEKQKEVALDSIDKEMDALEDAHDRKIKMLDDQISKIEEYIQAKLKQIDTDESERDFTKELQKLQEERQKIQNQINQLSMDDSRETQSKLIGLEEEKNKLTEQIDELTHDRQIELRKENLQDQLDSYKKDYDNKKSIEDDKFEKEKKRLEEIRRETERHYENLINDERRFAQIRESIMDGNLSNIKSMLNDFEGFIGDNMSTIGESIATNLIDRINEAREEIERLNDLEREYDRASSSRPSTPSKSNNSGSSSNSSSSSSGSNNNSTKTPPKSNLPSGWTGSTEASMFFKDGSISYGVDKNGYIYKNGSFVPAENYKWIPDEVVNMARKRKLGVYHQGGIIGDISNNDNELVNSLFNVKPNEQIIKALKGEVVINPDIAMPNFRNNLSNFANSIQPRQQSGGGKIEIKEFIKIDNITKDANVNIKQLVKEATDEFTRQLKPWGFTF